MNIFVKNVTLVEEYPIHYNAKLKTLHDSLSGVSVFLVILVIQQSAVDKSKISEMH